MKCAVSVSQGADLETLAGELLGLGAAGSPCDLAVLFFTRHVTPVAALLGARIRDAVGPGVFLGVSAEGVLGADVEIERRPGAALWTATLPGVELRPWHVAAAEWREALTSDEDLCRRFSTVDHRGQLVLADPFTTPVDPLLNRLDTGLGAPTFGGMASAASQPGGNLLLLNDQTCFDGAIGVGFGGPIAIDTIVSQGCRPVGLPLVATRTEGSALLELGRRPALEVAEEMLAGLPPADRALLENGLLVGVAIDEYRDEFRRGDFLVRGLLGVNREAGALLIGDAVRPGQTVQLHLRDASTATEDLAAMLAPQAELPPPAGGLVFSCNGRGQRMFDAPHHDIRESGRALPGVPLAGFFAMGELGPVGGRSFIHGHTASVALFRSAPG